MMRALAAAGAAVLLLSVNSIAQGASREEQIGNWTHWSTKDKIDDSVRYGISIQSVDHKAAFLVKCDEVAPDSIYVGFVSASYLGSGRYKIRSVRYRIDKRPPTEENWFHDDREAYQFDHDMARAIAKSLMSATRLVFEVTTFDYDTIQAEFHLGADGRAIARVLKECEGRS